ncbi:MAG: hypothetical protein LQ340_007606 [Diploschistes diacapsis]|nr:MAG: hypothetical protein LQ340_007606 [Diploschistes diacapsis]
MRLSPRLPAPSPLPTSAPSAELVERALEIRQGYFGGATCGYFSGLFRTDNLEPYCVTNIFTSPNLRGYACDSTPGTVSIDPTYFGEPSQSAYISYAEASFNAVAATSEVVVFSASISNGVVVPPSTAGETSPTENYNVHNPSTTISSAAASSTSSSSTLAPSLIAAIAIPSVIGILLLAAGTFFLILYLRKRNRRHAGAAQNIITGPYTHVPPYTHSDGSGHGSAFRSPYPDAYAMNMTKEYPLHSYSQLSSPPQPPSFPSSSPFDSPHSSHGPMRSPYSYGSDREEVEAQYRMYGHGRPGLNRENLDALSGSGSGSGGGVGGGGPRASEELARSRRLSDDGEVETVAAGPEAEAEVELESEPEPAVAAT